MYGLTFYYKETNHMNQLNSILIEGNLVRDPQFRTTPRGTSVCNFSIASNRFFKGETSMEKEVSYFEIVAFGKLAEQSSGKAHKGRGVKVVGRIKQERWNGNDGKAHSKVVIVAEHVEFRPEPKDNDAAVEFSNETAEETVDESTCVPTF
jgi:single-strand DNA-binding protein